MYCEFGQGDDYVYHGETVFRGINTGNELLVNTKEDGVIVPRLPKKVFPEYYLVRVNAHDKIPESPLDEWMEYLKKGIVQGDTSTPGLQQVKEKLRVMSMNEEERRAYDAHIDNIMVQNDVLDTAREEGHAEGLEQGLAEGLALGMEEGMKKGLQEGMEKGMEKGIEKVALNMIKCGIDENVIVNATGLTVEQIAGLRSSATD